MAATQCLAAVKADIESVVTAKLVTEPVEGALKDPAFLKSIIKAVAEKCSAEEPGDLSVVLPESLRKETEGFVGGELAKALLENETVNAEEFDEIVETVKSRRG